MVAARGVAQDVLSPAVEGVTPHVDELARADVGAEVRGARAELEDHRHRVHAERAARRLDLAVEEDAGLEVEAAVGAPDERVDGVVVVFRAEAREEDAPEVGLAVAVGVLEEEEVGLAGHVRAAVAQFDPGGDEKVVRKDGALVGATIAVRVLEDDDRVGGALPGFELGEGLGAGDPDAPAVVEDHLHGIRDHGLGGDEGDLKTLVHDEGLALGVRAQVLGLRHESQGERSEHGHGCFESSQVSATGRTSAWISFSRSSTSDSTRRNSLANWGLPTLAPWARERVP